MVDFRYHVVSIIAVFLALAVGIVLGNAALNDPVVNTLRGSISALSKDKRGLETDVRDLQSRVRDDDSFTSSVAADLVKGTLTDQRVLLLSTPEAPSQLGDQVRQVLEQAGATVTGRVRLGGDLLDPGKEQQLAELVPQVAPTGVVLPTGAAPVRAAAELAAALVHRTGLLPTDTAAAQKVLAAYVERQLLDVEQATAPPGPSTLTVLLTGSPSQPDDKVQQRRTAAVVALASALDDRSDGVVVAGSADGLLDGGVLRAVRADSAVNGEVSTVDLADAPMGRVLLALALREQRRGGVGSYGSGPRATAGVPSPSPS